MGGFKNLLTKTVGTVGRVLGLAPAAPAPRLTAAPQTMIYQNAGESGNKADQAAAAMEAQREKLRRDEMAREAEEARQKSEAEARAAEEKKRIILEEEARKKAAVAASGRASTILAGENDSSLLAGKSLLGG